MNPCLVPTPKPDLDGDRRWESIHNRYLAETKTTESEIVWLGDSIFQELKNSTLWKTKISPLHCTNFGLGGDRVKHLLWRIENGELDFSSNIKVIVLLVGTNNTNINETDVFEGIVNLVDKIRSKQPNAAIILLTLLPRGQFPNRVREKNLQVNNFLIDKYKNESEEKENIHLIPIHENIVQEDGTISHHVLHDYLHLTDYAYTKVFTPVYEKIVELLNEKKKS
ncbi:platelet-activating factor acetylhydrolase IB subunit beta homolog isoform X1 [Agrilus planipennis]|uniref:Platelet-activating factor acetylhydrolase IB subunit beta homolog isoform X1 n=1 Tax=Agrilus planipennis TaxID=224129 RepID=A0A1W4XJA3_AGRPL|nr:platelet-activating factor acetylhydrolase IB subunit beta homolog isoform X1 [Agrilus planipennis]